MKILVVGAGAVGGYFGARLAEAGRDVTFLVRSSRAQQLQRDGLRILSPHGDLTIKPQTITSDQTHSPFDVIFLSVKSLALDQAIADMAPAVGPATMIYPVLNGMRHIDTLAHRFGPAAVLGGVCLVSTELDPQGRIVQINEMQKLIYGEQNGQITTRIQQLDETLRGALQSLDECVSIAAICGHPTPEAFLNNIRQLLIARESKLTSSMYRDMQERHKVEVDTILGDLLEHGRSHNLKTPLLQAACVRLRVYQNSVS
jgi:2-dehydropantoate 2-reductase